MHDAYAIPQMPISFYPHYKMDQLGVPIVEQTTKDISDFLDSMGQHMGLVQEQYQIRHMSEILKNQSFRNELVELFSDPDSRYRLKTLVNSSITDDNGKIPVHGVCPCCSKASTTWSRLEDHDLVSTCMDKRCEAYGKEFAADLSKQGEFVMYYLMNLLRNTSYESVDTHFCGGDKLSTRGTDFEGRPLSILERGIEIMRTASENVPDYYVGPLITYRGKKLSKSAGTRYTYRNMVNAYQDWQQRLCDLTEQGRSQLTIDIRNSVVKDMMRYI